MFERTLSSSWHEQSHRGVTTLTSFGLQAFALAGLLIVPLLRPAGMPLLRRLSTPIQLGQTLRESSRPISSPRANLIATNSMAIIFPRSSARLPLGTPATDVSPPISASGPYLPGAGLQGIQGDRFSSFISGARPVIPPPPAAVAHPVRLSRMSEGDLVHKVLPTYPPLARSARIQGTVVLMAVISRSGSIENLQLLRGHPMLAPAAIEAVRQWRYRPYILNNEPVEVETQITLNFSLGAN